MALPSHKNAFAAVWHNPYVRVLVFLLLAYLTYQFIDLISNVVALAIIAYIIAYLTNPLVVWLGRYRVGRGAGVLLVALLILSLVALASALLYTIAVQLVDLVQYLVDLARRGDTILARVVDWLESNPTLPFADTLQEQLQSLSESGASVLAERVLPFLREFADADGPLVSGLFSAFGIVGNAFIILILALYMLLDFNRIGMTFKLMFPARWQPFVLDFSESVEQAVGGYVRGQLLIAALVGLMVALGLGIIGLPAWAAIGFLAGVFNVIPYLGVVIAIVPALLLAIPLGWLQIVLVVVVFVVANQVEGNFLSPYILGRTTDLHPVTVILSILIGLALFGIVGALIAVPLAALGKLLLEKYYFPSRVYRDGP